MGATLWGTTDSGQDYASVWQPGPPNSVPYVEPWYLGDNQSYESGVIPADSTLKPYDATTGATLPNNQIFTEANPFLYFQVLSVVRTNPPTDYTIESQELYTGVLQPLNVIWVPGANPNNWEPEILSMNAAGVDTPDTGRFYIGSNGSMLDWSGGTLTIEGEFLDLVITFGPGDFTGYGDFCTCSWAYSSRYVA